MSHPIAIAVPFPRLSTRGPRMFATAGTIAVLATAGCLTRTIENEGLVAVAAESDTTALRIRRSRRRPSSSMAIAASLAALRAP